MGDKLTYKRKCGLLAAGAVLLLWISYALAFSKTIELRAKCNEMENQIQRMQNAPGLMAALNSQYNQMKTVLGSERISEESPQKEILENISLYCRDHQLELTTYPAPMLEEQEDLKVETTVLEVEGTYNKLVKLAWTIEQKFSLGKLVAINFEKRKERKTRNEKLYASFYIQNVRL